MSWHISNESVLASNFFQTTVTSITWTCVHSSANNHYVIYENHITPNLGGQNFFWFKPIFVIHHFVILELSSPVLKSAIRMKNILWVLWNVMFNHKNLELYHTLRNGNFWGSLIFQMATWKGFFDVDFAISFLFTVSWLIKIKTSQTVMSLKFTSFTNYCVYIYSTRLCCITTQKHWWIGCYSKSTRIK